MKSQKQKKVIKQSRKSQQEELSKQPSKNSLMKVTVQSSGYDPESYKAKNNKVKPKVSTKTTTPAKKRTAVSKSSDKSQTKTPKGKSTPKNEIIHWLVSFELVSKGAGVNQTVLTKVQVEKQVKSILSHFYNQRIVKVQKVLATDMKSINELLAHMDNVREKVNNISGALDSGDVEHVGAVDDSPAYVEEVEREIESADIDSGRTNADATGNSQSSDVSGNVSLESESVEG